MFIVTYVRESQLSVETFENLTEALDFIAEPWVYKEAGAQLLDLEAQQYHIYDSNCERISGN